MQPIVTNAANEDQVKDAKVKVKITRDTELNDFRSVMSTESGARLLLRLLRHCGTHASIWEPSAKIHYNAGKQDVGHFVQSEMVQADLKRYYAIETELKGN